MGGRRPRMSAQANEGSLRVPPPRAGACGTGLPGNSRRSRGELSVCSTFTCGMKGPSPQGCFLRADAANRRMSCGNDLSQLKIPVYYSHLLVQQQAQSCLFLNKYTEIFENLLLKNNVNTGLTVWQFIYSRLNVKIYIYFSIHYLSKRTSSGHSNMLMKCFIKSESGWCFNPVTVK